MPTTQQAAALNALHIAGHLPKAPAVLVEILTDPSNGHLPSIVRAASMLADIEAAPGFAWNETTRNDWESVCAAIARKIGDGETVCRKWLLREIGFKRPARA